MLAKKVFYLFCPYFPLRRKSHFAELMQKKKRCNLKKITTLPKIHIQFCRTFSFALFFDFRYLFCGGCYNPKPRIAYPVEQRVKLPPLRVLFGGFV